MWKYEENIYLQQMITPLAYACPPLDNGHAQPKAFFILYIMKNRPNTSYTETPIRVAILIDGGYFIKRYNAMYNKSGNPKIRNYHPIHD